MRAVIGPPGTGKTMFGISLVRQWVAAGVPPDKIAYLAFTKAAATEAMVRVSDGEAVEDSYPWFRTIHSLCYRLMQRAGLDFRVLRTADLKKFAKETGLDAAYAVHPWEDVAETLAGLRNQGRTYWDKVMTAYTLSRISARNEEELSSARLRPGRLANARLRFIVPREYECFVGKYEAFKKREGLVDFTDMLDHAFRNPTDTGCRKVVVDEAQDLTSVHYQIIDRIFMGRAEELWFIGDDDQAIFGWSGASADEFLKRISSAPKVVLQKTHRFGQEIVDFSARIARRIRSGRIKKDIVGVAGAQGKPSLSWAFKPTVGDYLILHRHVAGCQAVAKTFIAAGMPFSNERGWDPLSVKNRVKAFSALSALGRGERVALGRAFLMIDELFPSLGVDEEGTKVRLVVHGAKKKLSTLPSGESVGLADLVERKLMTGDGEKVVREADYSKLKHPEDLSYYARVEKNGHDLEAKGPTITTIHGSKGREADHVVVFSEMSRKCWEDLDSEHRLAYVAATRTRHDVVVCAERKVEWANAPYGYPVTP